MALEPFSLEEEETLRREIVPPPDDPIKRAKWLHDLLSFELYEVAIDGSIEQEERRDLILKFSAKLVAATPNSELHAARVAVRGADKETRESSIGGVVTHGAVPVTGSLRSSAPKRPKR